METVYDWLTVAAFAAIIVLFLQRSTDEEEAEDEPALIHYLVAGAGCGVTNYLGNKGIHVAAMAAFGLTLVFAIHFLRPFAGWKKG